MNSQPMRPRRPEIQWRPTVPNPELFRLPKPYSKPITIKAPPSTQCSTDGEVKNVKSPLTAHCSQEDKITRKSPEQSDDLELISIPEILNGDEILPTGADPKKQDSSSSLGRPEQQSKILGRQIVEPSSKWRPDVFVKAFVPQSFLAVNDAPAKIIVSKGVEGINYSRYVSTFASPVFLPPRFLLAETPTLSGRSRIAISDLAYENYKQHFTDCVLLDLEAQTPAVRSYDLFGVRLEAIHHDQQIFSLQVPGLREESPIVSYGDIVLLRQLITDPATNLPRGMVEWKTSGACDKGIPAPGFTGCEITATAVAIDKRSEYIHLKAEGVKMFLPLVFNVSFVVQGPRVFCLQNAIADIANDLTSNSIHASPQSASSDSSTIFDMNLTASHSAARPWLHRMLFPRVTDGVPLGGLPSARFTQPWYDQSLNYEQMKAVDAIQRRNYGSMPFLVFGPPGTGKTKTIVEAVTQLATNADFAGTILVCAPSDPAADTLATRLKHHFSPAVMLRLNDFSRTFAEVPQELMAYCYVEENIFNIPALPLLMSYKIVVATCRAAEILTQAQVTNRDLLSFQRNITRILQSPSESQKSIPIHWTALFVDEAAQATEPEILISLEVVTPHVHYACHPDPIVVMAGDQYQLSPRTYDKTTALHVSFFERLSGRPAYASRPQTSQTGSRKTSYRFQIQPPFINLVRNYRSHPAILAVPSSLFYHNTLIPEARNTGALETWHGWQGRGWPVLFACNNGTDDCEDVRTVGGAGWYNTREAQKAIYYAADILKAGKSQVLQSEICIMSPFRAQVNLLRRLARGCNLWDLNIGPMEAFQGLESRFVIICTTRARTRFLAEDALRGIGVVNEPKKFNVAITRAKEGLIVFGNPWVLSRDPHWTAFIKFCWRNGLWRMDEVGRDPRMPDGEEADTSRWIPKDQESTNDEITGLEAALLYKEAEPGPVSMAARRFMGAKLDDEMWTTGMEAMETLKLQDIAQDSYDHGYNH